MKIKLSKKTTLALKIFASALFIVLILTRVDTSRLGEILLRVRWPLLLVAVAISMAAKTIGAFAWKKILAHLQMPISLFDAFRIRMGASFIAAFFPSQVGLLSRAMFLNALNRNYSVSEGISTIFLERLMSSGLIALATGIGWLYCTAQGLDDARLLGFLGLMFSINVGIIIVLVLSVFQSERVIGLVRRVLGRAEKKMTSGFAGRVLRLVIDKVEKIATALGSLVRSGPLMASFFLLTLANFFLGFSLTAYFILQALGIDLPFAVIVFLPLALTSLRVLPISFQGIGLTEGVGIVIFAVLGVARPEAAAFMFLYQIISNYMFRVIGGVFIPGLGGNVLTRIRAQRHVKTSESV